MIVYKHTTEINIELKFQKCKKCMVITENKSDILKCVSVHALFSLGNKGCVFFEGCFSVGTLCFWVVSLCMLWCTKCPQTTVKQDGLCRTLDIKETECITAVMYANTFTRVIFLTTLLILFNTAD